MSYTTTSCYEATNEQELRDAINVVVVARANAITAAARGDYGTAQDHAVVAWNNAQRATRAAAGGPDHGGWAEAEVVALRIMNVWRWAAEAANAVASGEEPDE